MSSWSEQVLDGARANELRESCSALSLRFANGKVIFFPKASKEGDDQVYARANELC